MSSSSFPVLSALDALTGALFLLTALGVVATRQVLASLQLFILQSLLLTLSAVLLGIGFRVNPPICCRRNHHRHQDLPAAWNHVGRSPRRVAGTVRWPWSSQPFLLSLLLRAAFRCCRLVGGSPL